MKEIRKERGIQAKQIATSLGISPTYLVLIEKWEREVPLDFFALLILEIDAKILTMKLETETAKLLKSTVEDWQKIIKLTNLQPIIVKYVTKQFTINFNGKNISRARSSLKVWRV